MLGGDIRGAWAHGMLVRYDSTRTLRARLADGDYDQHILMQQVGLYGQSAMLPGHPLNFVIPWMIGGGVAATTAGLGYWCSQVTIDLRSWDCAFVGPAIILLVQLVSFGASWWVVPVGMIRLVWYLGSGLQVGLHLHCACCRVRGDLVQTGLMTWRGEF